MAQEIPGVICQVYLLQHSCFILLSQWGMSIPLTFLLLVISFTAQAHLFSDGFSDGFPDSFAGWLPKQFQCCIPVSMVSFQAASQLESSLWQWLPSHHFLSFGSHLGRPAEGNHIRTSCTWWNQESKLGIKILVAAKEKLASPKAVYARSFKAVGCHLLTITENVAGRDMCPLCGFPVHPIMEKSLSLL